MTIPFVKYHGVGNDFILVDNREKRFSIDSSLAVKLCHRHLGIGGDGLICLQQRANVDAAIRIFNADGSYAAMCGNGLRCAAHFLSTLIKKSSLTLESCARKHTCHIDNRRVSATLGAPTTLAMDLPLCAHGNTFLGHYIDTGVPHLVIFTNQLHRLDLMSLAKTLRFDARFAPEGVNVNFAQKQTKTSWTVRTYERGVEGETLACGTGAAATCVAAWQKEKKLTHQTIYFLSKKKLEFDLFPKHSLLKEIAMTGVVTPVFQGAASCARKIELA